MNLKQLLAFPLAFAVAWGIAYHHRLQVSHYYWENAANSVRYTAGIAEDHFVSKSTFELDVVQRWLDGGLLPSDPTELRTAPSPGVDPWGNRYRAAEIRSDDNERAIGIYSLGRDGKTDSSGNDSDDVSSWSDYPVAYYRREVELASRWERALVTTAVAGVLLVPLFFILRTRSRPKADLGKGGHR